jgi:putative ABC transport system ATP-binding protein
LREAPKPVAKDESKELEAQEDETQGFVKSEKASRAAQVNLSARLNKDGLAQGSTAGFSEIWRLIKIARPEAKYLAGV